MQIANVAPNLPSQHPPQANCVDWKLQMLRDAGLKIEKELADYKSRAAHTFADLRSRLAAADARSAQLQAHATASTAGFEASKAALAQELAAAKADLLSGSASSTQADLREADLRERGLHGRSRLDTRLPAETDVFQ